MSLHTQSRNHLDELIVRYPDLAALRDGIEQAAEMLVACHRSGGKVLVCGNGGSAADAEHIVGELMKGFVLKRALPGDDVEKLSSAGLDDWQSLADGLQQGIMAISLNGHPALSSAVLNDNDPYMAFAQQTYVLGRPGDVLIGLSTSGNSRNVCNALKVAKAFGVSTIGFTGARPAIMDSLCDVVLKAPATETFKVQEYHLPVYHALCLIVEAEIFG